MSFGRTSPMSRGKHRIKRQPYKSRLTEGGLKQELDILTSRIVRKRDKACVLCGSTYQLQAGHLYSRRHEPIRFHLLNVHAQCDFHNLNHNDRPHLYFGWFQEKFGEHSLCALSDLRWSGKKFDFIELQRMVGEYRKLLLMSPSGLRAKTFELAGLLLAA